jgi:manganese oxidase
MMVSRVGLRSLAHTDACWGAGLGSTMPGTSKLAIGMLWLGWMASWGSSSNVEAPLGGVVRRVYVAARLEEWDYAPSGWDYVTGASLLESKAGRIAAVFDPPLRPGKAFLKVRYRQFSDPDFQLPVQSPPHLGVLGFLVHAEVGDRVELTLRNEAPVSVSAHPHGLLYTKGNEGLPQAGQDASDTKDDLVPPGGEFTYQWDVPERSGPGDGQSSSLGWLVHSHVDEQADVFAGVVGAVVVTRKGWALADGRPADVDREFFLLWQVVEESKSRVAEQWMAWALERANKTVRSALDELQFGVASEDGVAQVLQLARQSAEFEMTSKKHAVNGRMFGNLEGLVVTEGERVRWYSAALGDEVDLHTPHWHGNTVTVDGARTDVVTLLPATQVTADMIPDAIGTFLVHCHVSHHMMMGMVANYTVLPCSGSPCPSSTGQQAWERLSHGDGERSIAALLFGLLFGVAGLAMLSVVFARGNCSNPCRVPAPYARLSRDEQV